MDEAALFAFVKIVYIIQVLRLCVGDLHACFSSVPYTPYLYSRFHGSHTTALLVRISPLVSCLLYQLIMNEWCRCMHTICRCTVRLFAVETKHCLFVQLLFGSSALIVSSASEQGYSHLPHSPSFLSSAEFYKLEWSHSHSSQLERRKDIKKDNMVSALSAITESACFS